GLGGQGHMRDQTALREQGSEGLARHCDRLAAPVVEDLQREQGHRAPQADAKCLGEGFLAREALGEITCRVGFAMPTLATPTMELGKFLGAKDPAREALAPTLEQGLDAREADQVGTDPDDHRWRPGATGRAPAAVDGERVGRFMSMPYPGRLRASGASFRAPPRAIR